MESPNVAVGKKEGSVTGRRGRFTVGASPFNGVKRDFGLVLLVGLLLLLGVGRVVPGTPLQIGLLLLYGVAAALWVVVRTRQTLRDLPPRQTGRSDGQE